LTSSTLSLLLQRATAAGLALLRLPAGAVFGRRPRRGALEGDGATRPCRTCGFIPSAPMLGRAVVEGNGDDISK
jgi:hypothetical protein